MFALVLVVGGQQWRGSILGLDMGAIILLWSISAAQFLYLCHFPPLTISRMWKKIHTKLDSKVGYIINGSLTSI